MLTIDKERRIISGVTVISPGLTVDGRFTVDAETVSQVHALMAAKPDGTASLSEHDGETGDLVGRLITPRIGDDGILRADLEVFASATGASLILEAAEKMPGEFGLSINAPEATVTSDGRLRVRVLDSVDFAKRPAANRRGLLSCDKVTLVDSSTNSRDPESTTPPDMTPDEVKTLLSEALLPITGELATLKAQLADMKPAEPVDEEALAVTASAKAAESVQLSVDAAKAEAVTLATAAVLNALNDQLGARLGVKLKIASPSDDSADTSKPEGVIMAKLSALKAEGKPASECYRLAAQAHPAEYQAALAAGKLPRI